MCCIQYIKISKARVKHKSEFKLFNYNNYLESSDHDESNNDAPVDLDDIGMTIVSGSQDVVMASGVGGRHWRP